jgi:dienelactone hydrolase
MRMARAVTVVALLCAALVGCDRPAPPLENIRLTEFLPASGKGRVIIVLSGAFGPAMYSFVPEQLAKQGYYAVLLAGTDFGPRSAGAGDNLRQIILQAQQSPHAVQGKVAVMGFSAGGGAALAFATSLVDLVAVVVDYYPATKSIPDRDDVVRRWNVPTVVFAGDADSNGCCMINTITAMATSAKDRGAPVELVVYPNVNHDFILPPPFLKQDAAADAWQRALAALRQHLGSTS